ncbi:hypothetical protein TWF706_000748 [Orbilia oligospora]|nr:hypothetical protein TWF706_000748 [Orbilia oligospora]
MAFVALPLSVARDPSAERSCAGGTITTTTTQKQASNPIAGTALSTSTTMVSFTTMITSTTESLSLPPSVPSMLAPQTHTVYLNHTRNTFKPIHKNATLGDVIRFVFLSPNHSVVETSFEYPCTPKEGGFASGSNINLNQRFNNSVSFTVDSLDPRYFACGQLGHCQTQEIFAINVNSFRFSQFAANIQPLVTEPTYTVNAERFDGE